MSPRRRGVLLAGLALLLGGLAASDVAGREAALDRRIGPLVDVVVARHALEPGDRLAAAALGVRRVPARFAPAGAFADPSRLAGLRVGSPVAAGADLTAAALDTAADRPPGAPVRAGERVIDVAAVGAADVIQAGSRVDVLVTRDGDDRAPGRTVLALEDVEVLSVHAASAAATAGDAPPHVIASLRVTLRQAVYLAAAQSFARELRLLPRATGDSRRHRHGIAISDAL